MQEGGGEEEEDEKERRRTEENTSMAKKYSKTWLLFGDGGAWSGVGTLVYIRWKGSSLL